MKKMNIQSREVMKVIQNEIKTWKQINGNANIVRFVDAKQQGETVYILSELCSGGTILDLLEKYDGKLSEAQIIHISIDICLGLSHMHKLGIAHRDIKVENVLLGGKSFKLCDFGSTSRQILDPNNCSSQALEEAIEEFEKYTTMMYRPPEMIDRYLKYKVDT